MLVRTKKGHLEEVNGDIYRYFLLAGKIERRGKASLTLITNDIHSGTTHPYPDDTFYSVGRVPRKLLIKYLGVKVGYGCSLIPL